MHPLVMPSVYVLVGFVALVLGGELLVRGASGLASLLKISSLVIGLTVVAFGTSAPELAVAVNATLKGESDLSIGNIVGSNIFNLLGVLGASALVAPLLVSRRLIRFDVPLMVAVSFLALLVSWDGTVTRVEGTVLFLMLVVYTIWLVLGSRRETQRNELAANEKASSEPRPAEEDIPGLLPANTRPSAGLLLKLLGLIVVGLVCLSVGSSALVDGATRIAQAFHVSELLIGLTIVAIGTSLPEAATSVMASLRGERDIAVGNVVGSNLFNILSVLGITAIVSPSGVTVSPSAIGFDIPVMIAVALVCWPIFFTYQLITRWEGGMLLFFYALYTTFLIQTSDDGAISPWFSLLLWVALPLASVVLLSSVVMSFRRPKEEPRSGA